MIKQNIRRGAVMLAVLPLAATGIVLTAPAASAAAWETTTERCDTSKKGHDLDIKVKVRHNDDGDVDWTLVRATDREETGKFKEHHVRVTEILVEYLDENGALIDDDDDDDTPFEMTDDGEDVEEVKVTVTWKVHDSFKTKTCTVDDLD